MKATFLSRQIFFFKKCTVAYSSKCKGQLYAEWKQKKVKTRNLNGHASYRTMPTSTTDLERAQPLDEEYNIEKG